jgi:hypothetical protein
MQTSGASRREIAKPYLKLFWLFENRIGNSRTVRAAYPSRRRATAWLLRMTSVNASGYARTAVSPGTAAKPALLA